MEVVVKGSRMFLLAAFVVWLLFFPFGVWNAVWHRIWLIVEAVK